MAWETAFSSAIARHVTPGRGRSREIAAPHRIPPQDSECLRPNSALSCSQPPFFKESVCIPPSPIRPAMPATRSAGRRCRRAMRGPMRILSMRCRPRAFTAGPAPRPGCRGARMCVSSIPHRPPKPRAFAPAGAPRATRRWRPRRAPRWWPRPARPSTPPTPPPPWRCSPPRPGSARFISTACSRPKPASRPRPMPWPRARAGCARNSRRPRLR